MDFRAGGIVSINWSSVKPEHVSKACEMLLKGEYKPRVAAKGIFVLYKDNRLPAKQVARLSYCVANGLPMDTTLKFSSGDAIINMLQKRGQVVTRS